MVGASWEFLKRLLSPSRVDEDGYPANLPTWLVHFAKYEWAMLRFRWRIFWYGYEVLYDGVRCRKCGNYPIGGGHAKKGDVHRWECWRCGHVTVIKFGRWG